LSDSGVLICKELLFFFVIANNVSDFLQDSPKKGTIVTFTTIPTNNWEFKAWSDGSTGKEWLQK
jgi:hypothetical protein